MEHNFKLKYADLVKPQLKDIARQLKEKIEADTGKPHKVKELKYYSDEFRVKIVPIEGA